MKRLLFLALIACAVGAGCSKSSGSTATTATTSLAGTWAVTGTGACTSGCGAPTGSFQVTLVASPCSVITPLGTFTAAGTTCFIANNNSLNGSITGTEQQGTYTTPITAKNSSIGVLVGTAANPVPDNSTVNLVFVSSMYGGKFVEFTGTGTVVKGKITGSGSCSASSTSGCTGASVTFSATQQ